MSGAPDRRVVRLDDSHRDRFLDLHSEANDAGWCSCVAWWVPTWRGWGERTAEENRELRTRLWDRGEHDAYLLCEDDRAVASCQVGPRDRLRKLVEQLGLEPSPGAWAVTCFLVAPSRRREGLARELLRGVLADLPGRGARTVEAYPRRGADEPGDLWTGPEALYLAEGFRVVRDDPLVVAREL